MAREDIEHRKGCIRALIIWREEQEPYGGMVTLALAVIDGLLLELHEGKVATSIKLAKYIHPDAHTTAVRDAEERGARWMRESVDACCPLRTTCASYTDRGRLCPECPRDQGDDAASVCRRARDASPPRQTAPTNSDEM